MIRGNNAVRPLKKMVLGLQKFGRIGKLTLWQYVSSKYSDEINAFFNDQPTLAIET